jgi:aminopeptidase
MYQMKADMGGAATVCAAMEAIALLQLPINVTVLTPLCENMVSGNAFKPGDVLTASNGKTIEVRCSTLKCLENIKNSNDS